MKKGIVLVLVLCLLGLAACSEGTLSSELPNNSDSTTTSYSTSGDDINSSSLEETSLLESSSTPSVESSETVSIAVSSKPASSKASSSKKPSSKKPSSSSKKPVSSSKAEKPTSSKSTTSSKKPASSKPIDLQSKPSTNEVTGELTKTAYWTPGGKSYHFSKNCTTLKRSKTILNGTLQDALNAGKKDPCNLCAGGH